MEPGGLTQLVLEVERHAAASGWDRPSRVYGIVRTAELLAHEPQLADELGLDPGTELTSLDQGDLPWHGSLPESLERLAWPASVDGVALVTERVVAGADGPDGPVTTVANGDGGEELRLVAGVLRDGRRMCAVRFRSRDDEHAVLSGPDIAPLLCDQLAATLLD